MLNSDGQGPAQKVQAAVTAFLHASEDPQLVQVVLTGVAPAPTVSIDSLSEDQRVFVSVKLYFGFDGAACNVYHEITAVIARINVVACLKSI